MRLLSYTHHQKGYLHFGKKVFQTIETFNKSDLDIKNIKKINFFPSERIDIELENDKKIKFPINLTIENLNFSRRLIKKEEFDKSKIIDLRIPGKIITYD